MSGQRPDIVTLTTNALADLDARVAAAGRKPAPGAVAEWAATPDGEGVRLVIDTVPA